LVPLNRCREGLSRLQQKHENMTENRNKVSKNEVRTAVNPDT
jgi:hypothetical protein